MDDRELVARAIAPDAFVASDIPSVRIFRGNERRIALEDADRVLAALAKAGRLASEVKGDVVEASFNAAEAAFHAAVKNERHYPSSHRTIRLTLEAAAPIIAADAERRVRAEILRQLTDVQDDPHFSSEYGNGFDHAVSIVKDSNKCSTP